MPKDKSWMGEGIVSFRFTIEGVKAENRREAAFEIQEILQDLAGISESRLKRYKGVFAMDESLPHVEIDFVDQEGRD